MTARISQRGFTLIEVMIAVVILAVGLSALFTSEAGAVKIAQRARSTTIATLLARCKMGEVEEKVAKEGWPGDLVEGRDECCEGAEQEGFKCEWKVERITLPELDIEDGNPLQQEKERSEEKEETQSRRGIGETISELNPSSDGGVSSIVSAITGGSSGGGSDPTAAFVMELTFPIMKPVIEEGVRRATVIVQWKEGSNEQSFDLSQYLVNELPLLPDEEVTQQATQAGGAAGTAPGTTPGSGASGANSPQNSRQPSSGRGGLP